MNDQTLQALTTLAMKLGTTVEYLWAVLLKQAPISAAVDLLVVLFFVGAASWWTGLVYRRTRYEKGEYRNDDNDGFLWATVVLLVLFTAVVVSIALPSVLAGFFNPGYWALKQLIK